MSRFLRIYLLAIALPALDALGMALRDGWFFGGGVSRLIILLGAFALLLPAAAPLCALHAVRSMLGLLSRQRHAPMNEYFTSPPLPPESPSDRPRRHWFYRFFFETWWGPVVVWWTVALLNMILWVVSPFLGKFGMILETCCGGLLTLTTLAVIIAWIKTLVARQGARAAGQFAVGCLSIPVFAAIGSVALVIATPIVAQKTPGRGASHFTVLDRGVGPELFQIEYTLHHYIPTEYDKAIVFPSGKRIGLFPDTGGNAPFALYRLPAGEYYLVDSLSNLSYKNEYRVNAEAETVEMRSDDLWITIPDGTKFVTGGGGGSISVQTDAGEKDAFDGVPVGDSLRDREFRGIVHPDCRLESPSQVADPLAEIP